MANHFSFANVTKLYGEFAAINNVTFQVSEGEIVGFVGPNGAGKSTTIALLLGFIKANRGDVRIKSRAVSPESSHLFHKNIGYAAGDLALFEDLTGEQYLAFMQNRTGAKTDDQQLLIDKIGPKMGAKIETLSRGNRQKIALIGALQHHPDLIILDEPTSGLDPLMQKVFLEIIKQHAADGATVFMSSHILSEVASVCSRVLFIKQGKIIVDKQVSELEKSSGKHVWINATPAVISASRRNLPSGASIVSIDKTSITFAYNGAPAPLLRWLSARTLTDLTIEERDLDDIFEKLYHTEKGAE